MDGVAQYSVEIRRERTPPRSEGRGARPPGRGGPNGLEEAPGL